jgi:hypothetical protein
MRTDNQRRAQEQKSPQKRFLFVLGLVFFSLYLALGLGFIFWKSIPFEMPAAYRIAFGVLLIVYAFFRFIRLIKGQNLPK